VFGAQQVAVRRDESEILAKIKLMAAAAGEDWYYRFPVRKKVRDEETGKEEWVTEYIEGPSIKCANNVSRLYGNCDIDTRVFDAGSHYMFYARFMDLETGYSLVRPFQQRKSQKAMKTDAGRQEDIVFQIGASKAIRNVTTNAIEFFTTFAWTEAKNSIIEKVGKKLEYYRTRVIERLAEMRIDIRRVEIVRGRPAKDWLATDVARTIAELQAIQDGMSTVSETYLGIDAETGEVTEQSNSAASTATGEKSGDAGDAGSASSPPADPANNQPASTKETASQPVAHTTPSPGQAASESSDPSKAQDKGAATAADGKAPAPKNEAEYVAWAEAWIDALVDIEGEKRWSTEKSMRNKANVGGDAREALQARLATKIADIKDADRS
jgi:hypothetical protein